MRVVFAREKKVNFVTLKAEKLDYIVTQYKSRAYVTSTGATIKPY